MPLQRNAGKELMYKVGYHRNKLQLATIDAILGRVSPKTLQWLQDGPRPRRSIPLSPSSRPYLTRETLQSIEVQASSSSQALLPRALQ